MENPKRRPEPPKFTPEQLDYLDRLYPEKCPDPTQKARLIWMDAGARLVVRRLLAANRRPPTLTADTVK